MAYIKLSYGIMVLNVCGVFWKRLQIFIQLIITRQHVGQCIFV